MGCVALALLVGVGMAQEGPGLLAPYAFLILLPIAAVMVRYLRITGQKKSVSAYDVWLGFWLSVVVTIGVMGVMLVAAVVLLFIVCSVAVAGMQTLHS
jgi:hypothetical protein